MNLEHISTQSRKVYCKLLKETSGKAAYGVCVSQCEFNERSFFFHRTLIRKAQSYLSNNHASKGFRFYCPILQLESEIIMVIILFLILLSLLFDLFIELFIAFSPWTCAAYAFQGNRKQVMPKSGANFCQSECVFLLSPYLLLYSETLKFVSVFLGKLGSRRSLPFLPVILLY